jgi:hypothetical protein
MATISTLERISAAIIGRNSKIVSTVLAMTSWAVSRVSSQDHQTIPERTSEDLQVRREIIVSCGVRRRKVILQTLRRVPGCFSRLQRGVL